MNVMVTMMVGKRQLKKSDERQPPAKVFAKIGLDYATSTMCKHQQRFGLDVQFSSLVRKLNNIFSNRHLCLAVH